MLKTVIVSLTQSIHKIDRLHDWEIIITSIPSNLIEMQFSVRNKQFTGPLQSENTKAQLLSLYYKF